MKNALHRVLMLGNLEMFKVSDAVYLVEKNENVYPGFLMLEIENVN
jgi:hypothetical protein